MSENDEAQGGDSQAPGFADDLAKAFDELEAEADDFELDVDADAEAKAPDEAGEGGDDERSDEPGAEADDEDLEAVLSSDAPEHWSDDDKTSFDALPDEAKPLYLDKVKSLESGFNRKFEELAGERKALEPYQGFHDLFDPFRQDLAAAGITAEQYTRQLVATALQMRQDPGNTLRALAESHGVDLNQLVGKPTGADAMQDELLDPDVRVLRDENLTLRDEIRGLSTKFDQSQLLARQAGDDQVLRDWAQFTAAEDAEGNALYPNAEALREMVGLELAKSPPALGETTQAAMARVYEAVKWLNPDIRDSVLKAEAEKARAEAQGATSAKQREEQRKADVDKAKRAGRTVTSKSTPVDEAPADTKTWKEEVERQWDQAMA